MFPVALTHTTHDVGVEMGGGSVDVGVHMGGGSAAVVNESATDKLIHNLKEENEKIKAHCAMLEGKMPTGNQTNTTNTTVSGWGRGMLHQVPMLTSSADWCLQSDVMPIHVS